MLDVLFLAMLPQEHPGGASVILKYAGKDATQAYEPIHPKDALDKHLPLDRHLGVLDTASANEIKRADQNRRKTQDEMRVERAQASKPLIHRVLSLRDMEVCHISLQGSAVYRL